MLKQLYRNRPTQPSLIVSLIPIVALLATLITIIIVDSSESVQNYSWQILLSAAALCVSLSAIFSRRVGHIWAGIKKSASQILPAVPILIFIGTLSSTWMLSGVVPTMISYGLRFLDAHTFLFLACLLCAVVSVVTGSSWTTIATIGIALMGVGTVMGYHQGWLAGAIISGAYFGDKVSPLSDTTVLASSTCQVPLFQHIRFLMLTSAPAMFIALMVYLGVGYLLDLNSAQGNSEIISALNQTFNITPLTLIIPAITIVLIGLRIGTLWTLVGGTITGLIGIWVFQPQLIASIIGPDPSLVDATIFSIKTLATTTPVDSSSPMLSQLAATSGAEGMLPTIYLVLSAMIFGGVMIGTGMLGRITHAITSRIRRRSNLVGATVCSGLFLNSCTGDQYLSIIIGANIFKNTYRRLNIRPQTLSRTLEDSVSVTSVLIPWNSCGVTQSTVLGVPTIIYLPFCLFNILSPVMTMIMAWIGFRTHFATKTALSAN